MQEKQPIKKPSLADVQEQFETWRKNRRKKKRIPSRLWKEAARLSEDYPLSQISTALRVNYSDLRRHVMAKQSPESSHPACTFVEVDVNNDHGSATYTIELEDRFGSRMKMSCSAGTEINPIDLIKVFCSR